MIIAISITFFLGFIVESIVGFGGTLLAYAFLLFFFDVKELIITTIILPILASLIIISSDIKNVAFKTLLKFIPLCILGVVFGIWLFEHLKSGIIIKLLASFLVMFGFYNIFFKEIKTGKKTSQILMFVSGIIHGIIGVAGPLFIIAMKSSFKNKSELRSTMAVLFIIINLIRIFQLATFTKEFDIFFVNVIAIIPMWIGIIIGHKIHKKMTDKSFDKMLSIFFIISGILLFFR